MTASKMQAAFRWHMQNPRRVVTSHGLAFPKGAHALDALQLARADVASGKIRYPAPIRGNAMRAGSDSDKPGSVYVEKPESFGLRLVGRVSPDFQRGPFSDNAAEGWYDNPYGESYKDGSGLVYGLVYQLPARKGQSRFVAAYQHGENDSGALIDFGTIHVSPFAGGTDDTAREDDAAHDAARDADYLAKKAAEAEREYKTAWSAGSRWADEREDVAQTRAELLDILKERRALKGTQGYPALCKAITARVRDLLADIAQARATMRDLAQGDYRDLSFWPGEKRLQEAFNDGAGETILT